MTITFGSLFAGIGGFDLGFERAGMTCKWQVEIDDYANRVLKKHWPEVSRHRDIKTFPPSPESDWSVDVICGGFPCQDISYAGRGAGLDGERSGLFFDSIRVVRELRPRVVCMENVAALLTRGLDVVVGTLAEIGYDVEWHCIPAAHVGAPHIRDRVFIIGTRDGSSPNAAHDGIGRGEQFKEGGRQASSIPDTESERLRKRWPRGIAGVGEGKENAATLADTIGPGLEIEPRKPGDHDEEQPAAKRSGDKREWWAVEPDVGRVAHGVPNRVDRLRGLGNAVVPQVAELVGRMILNNITE